MTDPNGEVEAARARAAANPRDSTARRDLAAALHGLADRLVARGELDGALAAYRESLEISRCLRASQKEVSAVVAKMGDALVMKSAIAVYVAGNDTAWSLGSAGDVFAVHGDRPTALALYRKALTELRAQAAREPDNAALQRDIAWRLRAVGDALAAQDEREGALAAHREALTIRRALAAREPNNAGASLDTAWSLGAIGAVLEGQGDADAALAAYNECLQLRQRLAAADPGNSGLREDIAVTEAMIARVQERRT